MSKSIFAKIEESILKSTKPKYMDSKMEIDQFLLDKMNSQDKLPNAFFKSIDFNGMQVFTIGDENAKNTILYIYMVAHTSMN